MRVLLFLFGIYLLALGCLPCADDYCTGQTTVTEVGTTHSQDCHNEESCPPFCTCSCCSIQIVSPAVGTLSLAPLQQAVDTQPVIFINHLPLSGIHSSIWQPPRLG